MQGLILKAVLYRGFALLVMLAGSLVMFGSFKKALTFSIGMEMIKFLTYYSFEVLWSKRFGKQKR